MAWLRSLPHFSRLLLGAALAVTLAFTLSTLLGTPSTYAGTMTGYGYSTCADGTAVFSGQPCGNVDFAVCQNGTFAAPGAACSSNGSPFQQVSSSPGGTSACPGGASVAIGQPCPGPSTLSCAYGIVVSVTQSCPTGVITATTPANYGVGAYCALGGGGSIWVPAGASPASMGC